MAGEIRRFLKGWKRIGTTLSPAVAGDRVAVSSGQLSSAAVQLSGTANTGIYFPSTNQIGFATGGGLTVGIDQNYGVTIDGDHGVYWGTTQPFGVLDLALIRDGSAGTLAQKKGNADQRFRVYGSNGAYVERGAVSELITIAAAASTDSAANMLPAHATIEYVTARVVTAIPTATTFSIGDAATPTRFATGVSVAATTTAVGMTHIDQTGAAGPIQTAAAKIRITPDGAPAAATGQVRVTVFYRLAVAGTS